ncbi:MAG: bifunctional riboflavin kinase/FAD synthetase [Candidatus Cloacimonadota bacterium]|nr:MAG: bifunctional riboflavin kinase/FAD synthetase [Candidatus Cloacimonadota bacterium]
MKSLRDIKHKLKNPVVTLGTFDGVHLGHQAIMRFLKNRAKIIDGVTVVITYHPHPLEILYNKHFPYLLTEKQTKEQLLKEIGIDYVLWLDFDKNLSQKTPLSFIEEYFVQKLQAKEIIAGYDWHFGKCQQGDFNLLKKCETVYHYKAHLVNEVIVDGRPVSSTLIRNYLLEGNITYANKLLGHKYCLLGKIVSGEKIGRIIGFPTVNIQQKEKRKLIPKSGVYLTNINISGQKFWGTTYIGRKPTFSDNPNKLFIETHILNFDDNLNLQGNIQLYFYQKLRDEYKFPNIELLKKQITKDVEKVNRIIVEYEY